MPVTPEWIRRAVPGAAGRLSLLICQSMKANSIFAAALCLVFTIGGGRLQAQSAPESSTGEIPQYGTPYAAVPDPQDLVIYQVNIRSFSPEGNFAGVLARLDAIKALGANVLYLLPTYPVGIEKTVHSPYCVRDYKGVNDEFGTLEQLRTLVEEAHKRKMIVLFDWVANHTAWDNPWIVNKAWYKQDDAGNIIPPPKTGWLDVAALNYDSADMRKAMIDAMRYWVFAANIDGYRCDAADFIPADFWEQAIKSLRTIGTHKLLFLAEGKRKENYPAGFDMQYGFAFYSNLTNRVYGTHQSVTSFDILNTSEYREATGNDQVVRYISNHDVDQTEGSPLTTLGGRQGSVAAFVVAAYMKGVPMIYDGQEVGCPVKLSFFDKSTPIDWSINPDLAEEYKRIIGLRNKSDAIRRGELQSFSDDDVCAFTKTKGAEEILVIDNLRGTPSTYTVPEALRGDHWKDAYSDAEVAIPDQMALQAYQYHVYKKR